MIERREKEVKGIERVKGAPSKPNPLPNAFPKLCEWFSGRFLLKKRGTRTVYSLRGKSSLNLQNWEIKRKERFKNHYKNYQQKLLQNYQQKLLQKLSAEIITENHELVYQSRGKCKIYRDTGVSKNT